MDNRRGHSLVELLVSMAIFGLIAGIGLPAVGRLTQRAGLRSAVGRTYDLLNSTRESAISLEGNRGIRFYRESDGGWSYAVYDDGDKDGVLNADIDSGVDPLVDGPEVLFSPRQIATIGIPPSGLPDPDGGPRILPEASPVQFNRSMICSFAMDGSSTPGSIYLRTAGGDAAVIRSSGDGGRLTILLLDKGGSQWHPPS